MIRAATIAMLAIIAGCDSPSMAELRHQQNLLRSAHDNVTVFHDEKRKVTCWIYANGYQGGISCLPDGQVQP